MNKSDSIKELANALALFQSEVAIVSKESSNPFFKSKYASLDNIITTIRPTLHKYGLSFAQFPVGDNELETTLIHTSGEWISGRAKISPKDNSPQAQGSAITYMRRYALSAVLGLATEEDDDGNQATRGSTSPAKALYAKKQGNVPTPLENDESVPF